MEITGTSDSIESKECSQCYQMKPLSEYHSSGRFGKDGVRQAKGYCKECSKKYDLVRRGERYTKSNERRRLRYETDPVYRDKLKKRSRDSRMNEITYMMWYGAKRRCKTLGWEFDLTREDIVVPEYCPLLGIKINTDVDRKRGGIHRP